jgi:hypothetical protein
LEYDKVFEQVIDLKINYGGINYDKLLSRLMTCWITTLKLRRIKDENYKRVVKGKTGLQRWV